METLIEFLIGLGIISFGFLIVCVWTMLTEKNYNQRTYVDNFNDHINRQYFLSKDRNSLENIKSKTRRG
jgi:competence protein ComGC